MEQEDREVRITPDARAHATVSDIVLREKEIARLVFRPEIVDNPHDATACVRGTFIYQPRARGQDCEDAPTESLGRPFTPRETPAYDRYQSAITPSIAIIDFAADTCDGWWMSNLNRNPTTPTPTLILTPDQHAQLRDHLTALMEYAAWQRDCRTNNDVADREAAHIAAMEAANALDLLDTAVNEMMAMVREARVMDWASRVDGRVKH